MGELQLQLPGGGPACRLALAPSLFRVRARNGACRRAVWAGLGGGQSLPQPPGSIQGPIGPLLPQPEGRIAAVVGMPAQAAAPPVLAHHAPGTALGQLPFAPAASLKGPKIFRQQPAHLAIETHHPAPLAGDLPGSRLPMSLQELGGSGFAPAARPHGCAPAADRSGATPATSHQPPAASRQPPRISRQSATSRAEISVTTAAPGPSTGARRDREVRSCLLALAAPPPGGQCHTEKVGPWAD